MSIWRNTLLGMAIFAMGLYAVIAREVSGKTAVQPASAQATSGGSTANSMNISSDYIIEGKNVASLDLKSKDVFNTQDKVAFHDDFQGDLRKWILSINDMGKGGNKSIDRVQLVRVGGPSGVTAARLIMPGKAGDFRTELSLVSESGLQERWYAERIMLPAIPDDKGFIVMQWHDLKGEDKKKEKAATGEGSHPNMALKVKGNHWIIQRSFGDCLNAQQADKIFDVPLVAGEWTDWVVRVKWSHGASGEVQLWQNGKLVYEANGPNTYHDTLEVTPYFKTGIYRPTRKPKHGPCPDEPPSVIYLADVKIGSSKAAYQDVAPKH